MRSTYAITLVASLALCPFAMADLLWDNYTTPDPWDHVTGYSSERATLISETWVVDDAVFEQPVSIEEIQWIGARDDPERFTGADYIILDAEFNVIADVRDQPFDAIVLGEDFDPPLEIYEGTVQVEPILLDPGQYYFGARLVDGHLGRNYAVTSFTGADLIRGATEAHILAVPFGVDDWTPASQVLSSGIQSDFAYRINGTVIPEPASLILLLIGAAATLRRRS